MSGDVLQLENTVLAGRYRVQSRLVTDARAEIFLALDEVSHQVVVVKACPAPPSAQNLPSPTADELAQRQVRFRLEGVWFDRVSHPYIVMRLAGGAAHDQAGRAFDYHVLEYLPGGTLSTLSQAWQGVPLLKAVNLLRQVAAALTHCHALGVIHGDVVPENLLLTGAHQTLKLADFGSAMSDDELVASGRAGSAGRLSRHAPPEARLQSGVPLSAAADVYALARTLHATLTGDMFFDSQVPIQALPPKIATQPGAEVLLKVLRRARATNVTAHYPSVAFLVRGRAGGCGATGHRHRLANAEYPSDWCRGGRGRGGLVRWRIGGTVPVGTGIRPDILAADTLTGVICASTVSGQSPAPDQSLRNADREPHPTRLARGTPGGRRSQRSGNQR